MPEIIDSITGEVVPGAMETVLVPVRSDIVGFRDGSPIRRHPDSAAVSRMTKTEARKHLADAKRSIGVAQSVMKPTPQWIVDQTGVPDLTEEQVKRVVAQKVRAAEESLAALRRWLA